MYESNIKAYKFFQLPPPGPLCPVSVLQGDYYSLTSHVQAILLINPIPRPEVDITLGQTK